MPSSSSGLGSSSRPPSSFLCLLPPPDALTLLLFFLDFFPPRAAGSPFLPDHRSARQPGVRRDTHPDWFAGGGGHLELAPRPPRVPASCLTAVPQGHLSSLPVLLHLVSVPLTPPCPLQLPKGRAARTPSVSFFFSVLSLPTSPEGEQGEPALPSPSLTLTGVLALQHVIGAEELSQVFLLVVPVPVLDHLLELFHQHVALRTTTRRIGKAPAPTRSRGSSAESHNPLQDRQVAVTPLRKLKPER